jgi:hypothetical protein
MKEILFAYNAISYSVFASNEHYPHKEEFTVQVKNPSLQELIGEEFVLECDPGNADGGYHFVTENISDKEHEIKLAIGMAIKDQFAKAS